MHVRMKREGLTPRVQDGQSANACAETLGIADDDQQCLANCREQDVVELAWSGQSEGVDGSGTVNTT